MTHTGGRLTSAAGGTFVPSQGYDAGRLEGSVLLLPSVSIGNVAQLAVDLFVSTLGLERVGFLDDPGVLPFAGADAYEGGTTFEGQKLTTNLEVFQTSDSSLTVLQQRAPPAKSCGGKFVRNLLAWIQQARFSEVLVLSSADAARRVDAQMNSPFRFVATQASAAQSRLAARLRDELGVKEMELVSNEEDAFLDKIREECQAPANRSQEAEEVRAAMRKLPAVPGSGLTRLQIAAAERMRERGELTVPVVALVMFASEGDNIADAVLAAEFALRLLKPNGDDAGVSTTAAHSEGQHQWKFPVSWKDLFGPVDRIGRVELYQ